MGEVMSMALLFIFVGWTSFYIQGDRDYTTRNQIINNLTYTYTQAAGKKGELNSTLYNELENKLSNYGDFEIYIKAEKLTESGINKLEGSSVIGYDLRENEYDILTIFVESENSHFLGDIFEMAPMGIVNADYKLISKSSTFIQ